MKKYVSSVGMCCRVGISYRRFYLASWFCMQASVAIVQLTLFDLAFVCVCGDDRCQLSVETQKKFSLCKDKNDIIKCDNYVNHF